jgi:hypothetical protein
MAYSPKIQQSSQACSIADGADILRLDIGFIDLVFGQTRRFEVV